MLELEQLRCERADRLLFENVNVQLATGELLELRGQNGAGKSTLLRIMAGLSRAHSGTVSWQGEPITDNYFHYASQRLFLGHKSAIKGSLTAEENLRALCELQSTYSVSAGRAALSRFGLAAWMDVPCEQLSAGQQRRVALARLACVDAPLWLLDEPLAALDDQAIAEFCVLLKSHLEGGGLAVVSTHQALPSLSGHREFRL